MHNLESVNRSRWKIASVLTALMVGVYFGFIGVVAFQKEMMGSALGDGMSLGILLGALVIVAAWILTFIYVKWANSKYDSAVDNLRNNARGG